MHRGLPGLPIVIGDDDDAARRRDHLAYTRHGLCGRGVHTCAVPPSTGHCANAPYNMSGSRTSMPNCAEPSTFAGTCRVRRARVPTSVNAARRLQRHVLGTGSSRPLRELHRRSVRRHAAVSTRPPSTRQSAASTDHAVAAACDEHHARWAPAWRSFSQASRTDGAAARDLPAEQLVDVGGAGRRRSNANRLERRRRAPRQSASAARCRRPAPSRSDPREDRDRVVVRRCCSQAFGMPPAAVPAAAPAQPGSTKPMTKAAAGIAADDLEKVAAARFIATCSCVHLPSRKFGRA